MAQNYYIIKALGLDPSGFLLSKEVFCNAEFYLDTNVLIHALESKARHHKSFLALGKACEQLNINLKVCQISLNELDNVIVYNREILPKVVKQIPNETAPKVRGVFYQIYREQFESIGKVDFEELFYSFENPFDSLDKNYGVILIDDVWFNTAENHPETQELLQNIQKEYKAKRNRLKSYKIALHDALLMRWIKIEREKNENNIWAVTLDTSLPGCLKQTENIPIHPLAITLDVLLQWISPIAIQDDLEDDLAKIFSEAVKYQLLPNEKFFDLRDFLIFAEMEWSCKELPAKDVENCILYLKANIPNIDPSDSSSREKMAYEISKFFADPSRKYKQELERLEIEKKGALNAFNKKSKKNEKNFNNTKKQYEKDIAIKNKEIIRLKEEKEKIEKFLIKSDLKRSAKIRLCISILIIIAYAIIIVLLANKYSEGSNLFQKIYKAWPLFTLIPTLFILWGGLLIGKKRLKTLGLPFTKIFKN